MASQQQVKQYLAYWFQLGKKVWIRNGEQARLPQSVIQGERYSQEFEHCWQELLSPNNGYCYLEGTDQTIEQLLSPAWEVSPCSRCDMPVPMKNVGLQPADCPCSDLSNWPNMDLPTPRSPVDNSEHLSDIHKRLQR